MAFEFQFSPAQRLLKRSARDFCRTEIEPFLPQDDWSGHGGDSPLHLVKKLQQQGYNMEPALETDSLMVAMQAVKRGMALVVSRAVGELFQNVMCENSQFHPVKIVAIPKEVRDIAPYDDRHPIQICWHERDNNDLSHRWFREKIIHFMRTSPWMQVP